MEKNILIIFKSDLIAQLQLIKTISQKLTERAKNFDPDDIIRLESIAYQIHNLYNAIEDLLRIVATYFENNITDSAKWHSALLQRMTQNIPEIRPFLLSQESFNLLSSLRGFRHFFRHAYGTDIEYAQLKINLDKAIILLPILEEDVQSFLKKLSEES